jgi:hypothetical protein
MAANAANEVIWEMNLETHSASWSDLYAKSFGWKAAQCSTEAWFSIFTPMIKCECAPVS